MGVRRLTTVFCAVGFFWLLALHVANGFLNFMAKGGIGSKSGAIALLTSTVDMALVEPLGRPVAICILIALGIGSGWLVYRAARKGTGA